MSIAIAALFTDEGTLTPDWGLQPGSNSLKGGRSVQCGEIHEQCFRCTLKECDDTSNQCPVFVETGLLPNGRRNAKTRMRKNNLIK